MSASCFSFRHPDLFSEKCKMYKTRCEQMKDKESGTKDLWIALLNVCNIWTIRCSCIMDSFYFDSTTGSLGRPAEDKEEVVFKT
ncbi:hypothetical protein FKM82_019222 [Ascaphus truei]